MTTIPEIVLLYGTLPAMVVGMLNHLVSAQATGRVTPSTPVTDTSHAFAIRPDAWLNWRPKRRPRAQVLSVAELAECTCPDLCDRDHPNE
jgi:hypothetical protein